MIKLVVTDIDGCLTMGGAAKLPLRLFETLQEWNECAAENPRVPAITICTGRPQPYAEAIIQGIGCEQPAICESGGILYELQNRTLLINPLFDHELEKKYLLLSERVKEQFLDGTRPIFLEPGKYTELTIIPYDILTVDDIWEETLEFVESYNDTFEVSRTRYVVNFSPCVISKGVGVRWLAEKTGIDCSEMAGFGDAIPDIAFLREVGFSGCPANAFPEVKESCDFVSASEFGDGLLEFLEQI